MPLLSYDLTRFAIGVNDWGRSRAWIESNADDGWKADGRMVLPDAVASVSTDGTGAIELEPTPEGIKYQFVLRYHQPGANTSEAYWRSGWFSLTEDANLVDLATVDVKPIPEAPVVTQLLEARDEALAAAAQTEADRIAVEAVGTTNDTIIAGRIEDPASATNAALKAEIETMIEGDGGSFAWARVDNLASPFYLAHRGGPDLGPDNSLTAWRRATAGGGPSMRNLVMEIDGRLLGDGTLVDMHDTTVDRTTNSTGLVTSFNAATWGTVTLKGTGEPAGTVVDRLTEFAGKVAIIFQPYVAGAYEAFDTLVTSMGLDKRTFILSGNVAGDAEKAIAAGYRWASVTALNPPPLSLMASRGEWGIVAPIANITQQYVDDAHAYGLRVIPYSPAGRFARDVMLSYGVDGIFSDAPGWLREALEYRTTDLFSGQAPVVGMRHLNGTGTATFSLPDRLKLTGQVVYLLGNQRPRNPDNFRLRLKIKVLDDKDSEANGFYLFLMQDDFASLDYRTTQDSVSLESCNGYRLGFLTKATANMGIIKLTGNASPANIAINAPGAYAENTEIELLATVTPTSLRWETVGGPAATTYTSANATEFRGLNYLIVAAGPTAVIEVFDVAFEDVP